MDWKVNQNDQPCPQYQPKKWRFTYWGETPTPENNLPQAESSSSSYPLSQVKAGERVWLVGFQGKGGINRLLGMGLTPGSQLQVINAQPSGSVLVAIGDNRIGVGAGMAAKILVSDKQATMTTNTRIFIREMAVGANGRVIGYDKTLRGYKGKLLSMGLTPGTEFSLIRVAPFGDPVEIKVRGFHLTLRKQEADALIVEDVNDQ
jgi:ferrous iron transport protein A